jgi:virginiamycin A acetyltransferase
MPVEANTPYPISHINREMIFLKNFITNPNIQVGDYTYYHDAVHPERFEKDNVILLYTCKLIMGKFCQIAQGTKFIMGDANHQMDGFSTFPFYVFGKEWAEYEPRFPTKGDTIVGNDVWFGHGSVIMPGVKIGDGAIIGACSVVTKDVHPYTIVGGNPAKEIRKRFSEDIVKKLLEIQWWNWDIDKITRNIKAIVGADIQKLLNA